MNEQDFLQVLNNKALRLGVNPFLLLSGLEGLYTFRHTPLNAINYEFLDSLILTIFALRIGDKFHEIAQENLMNEDARVREAAAQELRILSVNEIAATANPYLASFIRIINGKSPVRRYHEKALEAAALEIENMQLRFGSDSVSTLIMGICKEELQDELNLDTLFNSDGSA